jgi:uncharacterized membrane protein
MITRLRHAGSAVLALLLAAPTAAWAQDRRDEQFYYPGAFNWAFLKSYPEAARLFNAFDYGHAVLYERLLTKSASEAPAALEKEYRFLTTDLLVRPPRFAVAEEVIEPAYAKLAWQAKQMFDWAHVLHRQIYDIYADERLSEAERDRLIERVTDYYVSRKDYAFVTAPKSMALMDDQYFSQVFRKRHAKFNGLIWAYHWLQVGLYEPFIEGKTPAEKKAGVKATLARFWSMLEDAPNRFPRVMPMTSAVAPAFSAKHPRAAVIFDNLHMMHDIISDVLAADTIPAGKKREVIYAQLAEFRDSTRNVISMEEWRNMAEHMGGIAAMGGPATGLMAPAPAGEAGAMDHERMGHGAAAAAADSAKRAPPAPAHEHQPAAPVPARQDTARAPAREHRHEAAEPARARRPAPSSGDMMEQMMKLHERMMADSLIRQRVLADTAMRRMIQEMMREMPAEHQEHMRTMMSPKPAPAGKPPAHAHPPTDTMAASPASKDSSPDSMTLLPMHSWHPAAVHLPLVAFLLAAAFDLAGSLRQAPKWRDRATPLWGLGLAGAAVAVTTGLLAYSRVDHSDPSHDAMTLHRNLALASLAVLAGAAAWRWRRPLSRGAATLAVAGALGIGVVGYLGGDMVFSHGIGLSNERMTAILEERGHDHRSVDSTAVSAPQRTDSAAPADSAKGVPKKGHAHAPGQEH